MADEVALGIVRSYTAGPPRTAAVRVVGGLESNLAAVPVAAHVAAADLTAGRECVLGLLEPNDPRSAVVLGVVGTSLASGGGTPVVVEEGDVQKVAALAYLDFGLGFDVTEGPSGEANIALDLTESVWTFGQGGFRFRDGSGPLLSTGASGDDLALTGDLDVSGVAALGNDASAAVVACKAVRIWHNTGDVDVYGNRGAAVDGRLVVNSTSSGFSYGFLGEAENLSSVDQYLSGLCFAVLQGGSGGLLFMRGVDVTLLTSPGTGAVSVAAGVQVTLDFQGPHPGTFRGFYLATADAGTMVTAYGLRIEDMVGTTIRLMDVGPSPPYLRLVGGAAPAANETNLYLAEGVTPTLRRVQWKLFSALVAGDKVMVLV